MCSWALECFSVFLVSLQTLLFCLISPLYAWLYQLQVYHSVSKVFKTIGAPFCHLLPLSPLLCLIPINPAVTTSVPCFCHLFSSQVPHKSELPLKHFLPTLRRYLGTAPLHKCPLSTLPLEWRAFSCTHCTLGTGNVGSQQAFFQICASNYFLANFHKVQTLLRQICIPDCASKSALLRDQIIICCKGPLSQHPAVLYHCSLIA